MRRSDLKRNIVALVVGGLIAFNLFSEPVSSEVKVVAELPEFWFGLPAVSRDKTAAAPLIVGQNYRWYLSVVCDRDSRTEDLVVSGKTQICGSISSRLWQS